MPEQSHAEGNGAGRLICEAARAVPVAGGGPDDPVDLLRLARRAARVLCSSVSTSSPSTWRNNVTNRGCIRFLLLRVAGHRPWCADAVRSLFFTRDVCTPRQQYLDR
jgi:hypothetical protein